MNPIRGGELDFLIMRLDYASSTIQYIGTASPGTATSDARWQLKRLTLDASGRTTAVQFANGTSDFVSIWDSRASYTYS